MFIDIDNKIDHQSDASEAMKDVKVSDGSA